MSDAILDVSCDEAGHTGPDLLNPDQRFFAFASVAIPDNEAKEIIDRARAENQVQMTELKASRLMMSANGRQLITSILKASEGRYAVSVHEKRYALCCHLFEYIYEPVFQDNPWFLCQKNFHRFVAMYAYLWMTDDESGAVAALTQFQKYMRSLDPKDAPVFFATRRPPLSGKGTEHPFESVLRFAYGYRDIIIADNTTLKANVPDQGKWVLDLATTSLWVHLNYWGRKGKLLSVRCDASKPLASMAPTFTGDENDPGIRRARSRNPSTPLGWKQLEPIAFVDSRSHLAIQLADIVAGTAAALFAGQPYSDLGMAANSIAKHGLPESMMPDLEIVDPSTRQAMVNSIILYGLADRAEAGENPYKDLEAIYRAAEVSWVKGELR